MFLKKLQLINFRNFEKFEIDLPEKIIICGPNGIGKTNILESVFLLATSKSFKTNKNIELVQWEKEFARVVGFVKNNDADKINLELIIDLSQQKSAQKIAKIGNVKKKLFFLLGKLKAVFFSPESLTIIFGSPQDRRRFLDIILSQTDSKYARDLIYFNQILKNRNRLLYGCREGFNKISELDFWDQELGIVSEKIYARRLKLVNFLNQYCQENYSKISGTNQKMSVIFKSQFLKFGEFQKDFQKLVLEKRNFEIARTKTLVGPHKDDLIFFINKRNISAFGSRGEAKSAVLILKLAEIGFLTENCGETPILLLDDVFSELDINRRKFLSDILNQTQVFITTTDLSYIDSDFQKNAKIIKL